MIFLNKDIENDKNKAQHIKNKLEYTLLKDLNFPNDKVLKQNGKD